ncbi:MAG TPA: hypothetical protein PLH57_01530 [Oligoflexia bacterium]|nr:hypothetical protein [Oligoflexia bacterium]
MKLFIEKNLRSLYVVLALVFVSFVSQSALAQQGGGSGPAIGSHTAGFGLGQVMLLGDFGQRLDDSIGFQFLYEYQASELFGLYVTIEKSSHSNANETEKLSLFGVIPHLRANMAYVDQLTLFGFTGFGLMKASQTQNNVEGSVLTVVFDVGGGFDLALSERFVFGTTFAFHNVFGKTDSVTITTNDPDGFSIGGTYLSLMLNVKYRF